MQLLSVAGAALELAVGAVLEVATASASTALIGAFSAWQKSQRRQPQRSQWPSRSRGLQKGSHDSRERSWRSTGVQASASVQRAQEVHESCEQWERRHQGAQVGEDASGSAAAQDEAASRTTHILEHVAILPTQVVNNNRKHKLCRRPDAWWGLQNLRA